LRFLNLYPGIIINDRGAQNQEYVFGLPAHIKIIAGGQQKVHPVLMRQDKVQEDNNGKKYYKLYGVKQHPLST
jgi:hypothetical protein